MRLLVFTWLLLIYLPLGAAPEAVLQSMSLEEKIGQLFLAGLYPDTQTAVSEGQHEDPQVYIERMIVKHHIGGVLFKFRWNPEQVIYQTERLQRLSSIPLFMAIDAEWGLSMRVNVVPAFPKNGALEPVRNEQLIYEMGKEVGRQCRVLGINWNFAPVVDINTNPHNPVINERSFGSDKHNVARKGSLMIRGLQEGGVLATAKHFPGHGDTDVDSHTGLPIVNHSKQRIMSEELVPFHAAIKAGVKSMMCAHLLVPSLDEVLPTSLSKRVVGGLLRGEMGFQGLVVTDDLIMGAITSSYKPGEAAVLALLAGSDVLLASRNIEESIAAVDQAVRSGRITEEDIDQRVRRILAAKEWISRHQRPSGKLVDQRTFRLIEKMNDDLKKGKAFGRKAHPTEG